MATGHPATGPTDVTPPDTAHDSNSELVRQFGAAIHHAASIGRIADAVIGMAKSRAWRDYILDGHRAEWGPAEFDYFLIANGVRYADMEAVLKWRADAAQLAPKMDPKSHPGSRRPLRMASDQWDSPLPGKTLVELAKQLGWVTERGRSRKPPVGRRARARAAGGSREARAREGRRQRIGPGRCAELAQFVADLAQESSADECRFIADELNVAAGRSDGGFAK
jgi:hypothetical protein